MIRRLSSVAISFWLIFYIIPTAVFAQSNTFTCQPDPTYGCILNLDTVDCIAGCRPLTCGGDFCPTSPTQCECPDDPPTLQGLENVFSMVLTTIIGFAGIALLIMFLIGGFKYITSAGDPKKVESAGKTLTSAILGLVLVVMAYLILLFISQFTGIDVTTFRIFQP